MKPVIGIVGRPTKDLLDRTAINVLDASRRAIITNGGCPIGILPPQDLDYVDIQNIEIGELAEEEKEMLTRQIELCDGLLFQGGSRWYFYDEFIYKKAVELNKPCLGYCMSMQLMGKTDMKNHGNFENLVRVEGHKSTDDYVHNVIINKDSILYKIIGKEKIRVNSKHLFSVPEVYDLNISARSEDGVIEGVERKDRDFVIGLQWHPEFMYTFDEDQNKIFKYFIEKCKK